VRLKDEIGLAREPEAAGDEMALKECRIFLVVGLIFDGLPQLRHCPRLFGSAIGSQRAAIGWRRLFWKREGERLRDARFHFGDLHVRASGESPDLCMLAHGSRGIPSSAMSHLAAHRMVMVRRLHCRFGVATDALDERCIVDSAGGFLLVHVGFRISLQAVPLPVSSAGDRRGAMAIAKRQAFIPSGLASGGDDHGADDLSMEQPGFVGSQLGAGSASLVPRCGSVAIKRRRGIRSRKPRWSRADLTM
jgi:hypothetical protein